MSLYPYASELRKSLERRRIFQKIILTWQKKIVEQKFDFKAHTKIEMFSLQKKEMLDVLHVLSMEGIEFRRWDF